MLAVDSKIRPPGFLPYVARALGTGLLAAAAHRIDALPAPG
jgi:hypothetical protein